MNRRELGGVDAGRVHLPGLTAHGSETLCGVCRATMSEDAPDTPTNCPDCIRALEEVVELLAVQKQAGLWPPPKPTPADDRRLMGEFRARVEELGASGNAVSKDIQVSQTTVARILRDDTTRLTSRTRNEIKRFLAGTGDP